MKIGQWQKRYSALWNDQFWEITYGENCKQQRNKLQEAELWGKKG